ncbi:MAG: hypothetical protein WDO74_13710 [Pseudomonadota bacterium]
MLSASYERWRRNHHPYPLHLPDQLQQLLPLSMQQVTPLVVRASDNRRALSSVCRGIDSDLKGCRSPELDRFRANVMQAYQNDGYFTDSETALMPSDSLIDEREAIQSHTDIDFDPDTSVTTVTASSYFPEVSTADATRVIAAADPPRWKEVVPRFFLASDPGIWNPELATFEEYNPPKDTSVGSYHLQERVEWNWSPQLIGGTINILEIVNKDAAATARDPDATAQNANASSELIDDVKKRVPSLQDHLLTSYASSAPAPTFRHYDYRLIRCVQSKFLSSWQRGGLDVDEGYYKAAWVPQQADVGTLVIQARKAVHYSRRADVVPGLASMLNLMAPAITSLLMRNLGYRGVSAGLNNGSSSSSPAILPGN